MSHEFYYTSVARGLVKGSKGFCAVAMTKGLPQFLSERLEDLSGYKPLYSALDTRNPVNWAHYRLDLGGQTYHVLSRICSAGLDYSERTNKFAHHVVLTPEELPAAGPGWLLQQMGFMEETWALGEPRWLAAGRKPPAAKGGSAALKVCTAWAKLTGDAGWAGVLAETALASPARPAVVLCEPGTDVLALFAEALLLLPEKNRWRVTFSTYAASVPPGETCLWRGLIKDQAEADSGHSLHGAVVIAVGKALGQARGGPLVDAARTGKPAALGAPANVAATAPSPPTKARQTEVAAEVDSLPQVSLSSLSGMRAAPAKTQEEEPIVTILTPLDGKMSLRHKIGLPLLGLVIGVLAVFAAELVVNGALADLVRGQSRKELIEELDSKTKTLDNKTSKFAELEKDKHALEKKEQELQTKLTEANAQIKDLERNSYFSKGQNYGEKAELLAKLAATKKDLDSEKDERKKLVATLEAKEKDIKKLENDKLLLKKSHDMLNVDYQRQIIESGEKLQKNDVFHNNRYAQLEKNHAEEIARLTTGPKREFETMKLVKNFAGNERRIAATEPTLKFAVLDDFVENGLAVTVFHEGKKVPLLAINWIVEKRVKEKPAVVLVVRFDEKALKILPAKTIQRFEEEFWLRVQGVDVDKQIKFKFQEQKK